MKKLVVLGNAAGGKSTLSRRLAQQFSLPLWEVDDMQWRSDWSLVPEAEYQAAHDAVIEGEVWLLDGLGSWRSVVSRCERADAVVLIDLPLWIHYWLAAERQRLWHERDRDSLAARNNAPPATKDLFEIMWETDKQWLPKLRTLVDSVEQSGRPVYRLVSLEAITSFPETLARELDSDR